jgi:hypothetical protein
VQNRVTKVHFLIRMISLSLSESQFNGNELKTSFLSNWVHVLIMNECGSLESLHNALTLSLFIPF